MPVRMNKDQEARMVGKKIGMALAAAALTMAGCYLDVSVFKKPIALAERGGAPMRTPIYHQDAWTIARGSIHNHTIYSDGKYTPEDLLELARRQGMAVLGYNDHREGKICMSKAICVQTGGVEKPGYAAYYERLAQVQEIARSQGMIATRGIEVSPPYMANTGKFPFLVLYGQGNHFAVYGVKDPAILERMPVRRDLRLRHEPMVTSQPFQDFVDYIATNGGIVDAVHVESGQDMWIGTIHVLTPAPIDNLRLKNLTGFSILPEAWHDQTGGPGGTWDQVLIEYLAGMRRGPLWACGDADFHGPTGSLARSVTLFYMKEFSEDEVYRCMRDGRMVALMGESFQNSYVSDWSVSDGAPADRIMLGASVMLQSAPQVRFALDHAVPATRTRLIRNGKVVAEADGSELSFTDTELAAARTPAYYRVEVIGPQGTDPHPDDLPTRPENELFVNPIFVRFN
jgi:hypothetical protein